MPTLPVTWLCCDDRGNCCWPPHETRAESEACCARHNRRYRPKPGGWAERRPKPSHSIQATNLLVDACMKANVDALVAETAAAIRNGVSTEAPARADPTVAEVWAWRIREIAHATAAEASEAHSLGVLIPTDRLDVTDVTKLERYLGEFLWGKSP